MHCPGHRHWRELGAAADRPVVKLPSGEVVRL
jgi:hypothetical protein